MANPRFFVAPVELHVKDPLVWMLLKKQQEGLSVLQNMKLGLMKQSEVIADLLVKASHFYQRDQVSIEVTDTMSRIERLLTRLTSAMIAKGIPNRDDTIEKNMALLRSNYAAYQLAPVKLDKNSLMLETINDIFMSLECDMDDRIEDEKMKNAIPKLQLERYINLEYEVEKTFSDIDQSVNKMQADNAKHLAQVVMTRLTAIYHDCCVLKLTHQNKVLAAHISVVESLCESIKKRPEDIKDVTVRLGGTFQKILSSIKLDIDYAKNKLVDKKDQPVRQSICRIM